MARLELRNVAFSFAGNVLFENASAQIGPGITGLLGDNGSGKSTLLKLLSGELAAHGGSLRRSPAEATVLRCEQSVEHVDSVLQAFVDDVSGHAHGLRVRLGLSALLLSEWQTLSPGQRRRFQIGAALWQSPDILLLDEPTNHVDAETRCFVIDTLRAHRGCTVLVSHDRGLLDELCSSTLRISGRSLHSYQGGYSTARQAWQSAQDALVREKDKRVRAARSQERKLADARRVHEQTLRGLSTGASMSSKNDSDARGIGAQTLRAWAEAQKGRAVALRRGQAERAQRHADELFVERERGRNIFSRYQACPRPQLCALSQATLKRGDRVILQDVSVQVARGSRVRIDGPNGAGKTTLLSALYQQVKEPERVLHLAQDLTQREVDQLLARTRALPRDERSDVLQVVAALRLDPDRLLQSKAPSPGEARKLALAFGLARNVWCVLLDEPTNHLDVASIERLEAALALYPGALLVVSHDPTFAVRSLRERWQIEDGRLRVSSLLSGGPS